MIGVTSLKTAFRTILIQTTITLFEEFSDTVKSCNLQNIDMEELCEKYGVARGNVPEN